MNILSTLLLFFNLSIETLRMYNPQYYIIKEIGVKKIEQIKKINRAIVFNGQI